MRNSKDSLMVKVAHSLFTFKPGFYIFAAPVAISGFSVRAQATIGKFFSHYSIGNHTSSLNILRFWGITLKWLLPLTAD